jgi:hypothetical protein
MALNSPKFRHRSHLFAQHSFGFALFHADQLFWLVIVDNVHDMQLRVAGRR